MKRSVQAQVFDEARIRDYIAWLKTRLNANDIPHLGENFLFAEVRSPEASQLGYKIFVHVTHRDDPCGLFVGNLEAETLFDGHHELYRIEAHFCRLTVELSGGKIAGRTNAGLGIDIGERSATLRTSILQCTYGKEREYDEKRHDSRRRTTNGAPNPKIVIFASGEKPDSNRADQEHGNTDRKFLDIHITFLNRRDDAGLLRTR
jgi:hypothetical protein